MDTALGTLTLAAVLSFVGTAAARAVALRFGIINAPNPIVPDHVTPVPYLGGLGIALGVFGTVVIVSFAGVGSTTIISAPAGMILGGLLFLGVGLADDLLAFGATAKLLLQVGCAAVALVAGGLTPIVFGNPAVDALVAGLYIVAVVNAVNFIDVSDGLAATVAAVTAGLFAVALGGAVASVAVVGACLGFLVWNRPPARVFMGDAGSLFLGFMLAAFALTTPGPTTWWPLLPMLALFLCVPLFDLVFQSSTRFLEGRPWWIGGPDSYALRLQKVGLNKSMVALASGGIAAVAWLSGWLLPDLAIGAQVAVVLVGMVAALMARRWLLRYTVQRRITVDGLPSPAAASPRGAGPSVPAAEPWDRP